MLAARAVAPTRLTAGIYRQPSLVSKTNRVNERTFMTNNMDRPQRNLKGLRARPLCLSSTVTSLLSHQNTQQHSSVRYNSSYKMSPEANPLEPSKVPIIMLSSPEAAIYPETKTTLFISNAQYDKYKNMSDHQKFGLFLVPEGNEELVVENPSSTKHVYSVGVLAYVEQTNKTVDGYNVSFRAQQRIKFDETLRAQEDEQQLPTEPSIRSVIRIQDDNVTTRANDLTIKAYHRSIVDFLNARAQPGGSRNYDYNEAVWAAAAQANSDAASAQKLLEAMDLRERQILVLHMIKTADALQKLQMTISQKVDEEVNLGNRNYLLKQQMKYIKKELGGEEDKKNPGKIYEARLKGLNVPEPVMKVIKEEIGKLSGNDMHSSEQNVIRNYLDWLTSVPWGLYNKENLDILNAEKILAEDHHGLKDVKERILEFIAVGKLRAGVQGKILCFVGPPGVGKTSIGKSIAKATNREFYRFSLGGMRDVAEIRGHRRTYIGAMPGKIVQCLKTVKSFNPVIMIDEIDKIGSGSYNGDPASALLEVLDREQNNAFMDLYMDVPIDLSKVLWVATANYKDNIPAPLLDRMEVVNLSGYVLEEKVQIANKYLIPKGLTEHGLPASQVKFTKEAVTSLIQNWCREAGVRYLQNQIEKILRKIAFKVVKENKVVEVKAEPPQAIAEATAAPAEEPATKSKKKKSKKTDKTEKTEAIVADMQKPAQLIETITVDEPSLTTYVGQPHFNTDRYYENTPVGVVMGLGANGMGGSIINIEATMDRVSGKPGLHVTGQLGDVMKESSQLALTYAKNFIEDVQYGNRFFETASIHMHFPAGATPKDGPSAGVSMVSCMISLALQRALKPDVAMTGEITLTGKVLPIGGVKEKTIAARRGGIKTLIFPKDNKRDWDELEGYIKGNIKAHFVANYRDLFDIAFDPLENVSRPGAKADTKRKKVIEPIVEQREENIAATN